MNKNICFIELIKDENGFYKAVQNLETACIRSYLKENGIDSMVYVDESLPSISDMCEDILSLSDEVLVFIVNKECKEIMKVLISYIKELEDCKIYIIGNHLSLDDEEVINLNLNTEKILLNLLSEKEESDVDLLSVSPYENGIILPRDVHKYGIWLGKDNNNLRTIDAIRRDVSSLLKTYSGLKEMTEKKILFKGLSIENKEVLLSIINELNNIESTYLRFVLPINENLISEITNQINEVKNCRYSLNINEEFDDNRINELLFLIQNKKIEEIKFPVQWLEEERKIVSILLSAKKEKLIDIYPIGEVNSELLSNETKSLIFENTKNSYLPFLRGFLKSRTGLYGGVKLDGYVHHVEISEETSEKLKSSFMNEVISVNSSIYMRDKKVDVKGDKCIFNEIGVASINNKNYENHLKEFTNNNLHSSNLIFVNKNKINTNSLAYISDSGYYEISYKEAKSQIDSIKETFKNKNRPVFVYKLNDKEDYETFLKDAEEYKKYHLIKDLPLAYGYLENSCRFVLNSDCFVDKLPRIKVDSEGNIRTCDYQTEPISKIGDSLFDMGHKCFSKREKIFQERSCYECKTKAWCARCTELPEFIKESYCSVMKSKAYVLDYSIVPFLFLGLIDTNPKYSNLLPEEVKVSNEYMFNFISKEIRGEVAPYLPKFTSIVACRDKYLFWSPVTNKYYNVSYEFAYVIELLLRRVKEDSLVELLSEGLSIDINESENIMKFIINNLKKAGVIYREIEINVKIKA